ncbi:helix-turn-helix domain-containing protein [Deinococcus peraridilitoris]|uniref:DNA-binding protein, excisionase family n=1 Tax=Deinococcus peraridilitoris (strain DSM 19664 / LMG 22246 / CIP 109416 / KR-200) TaxID=937777 RepID=L0A7X0_DEIPD|nr:helix-turn-helix domain-containing protein [Deinococcus peraridilitoris]AFZ69534.1 DNA-binding protein, excisionase family [Deinococcus peraridilitoris DSM 19664]
MKFEPQPRYFYTPSELAELLRVSEATIRRMIRRGEIEAVSICRQYRISHIELSRLLGNAGLPEEALPPTPWQQLESLFKQ